MGTARVATLAAHSATEPRSGIEETDERVNIWVRGSPYVSGIESGRRRADSLICLVQGS